MKKRTWIIIGVILACGVFGAVAFFQLQPKLVTGEKTQLQKVVIYDYDEAETIRPIKTIDDKQRMYALYDAIRRTTAKKSYEMETPYSMRSPDYLVVFQYAGKEDEIMVYRKESGRYLGKPDWYTVSKSTRIICIVEAALFDE